MFIRSESPGVRGEAVLEALEHEQDRLILACTQREALDPQSLLKETGIPKSTLYRRLNRLEELGLVRVEGGAISGGHRVDTYRATVEEASLVVSDGQIEARWRMREPPDAELYGVERSPNREQAAQA